MLQEEIGTLCKKMLIKFPFYGFFTLGLRKLLDESISTACVGLNGINCTLRMNPKFMESLTREEKMAIMIHEVRHIAHNHIITHRDYKDKSAFNIAADLYINCGIDNLPEFALLPEKYNLPRDKSTKWYYKKVKEEVEDPNGNQALKDLHEACEQGKKVICQHDWKDFEDVPDATKELIKAQIEHQAKDIVEQMRAAGYNTPQELSNFIDGLFKIFEPTLNWQKEVKRFVDGSVERYRKTTKKKANKRFEDARGRKTKFKPRAIVYLDGSGSVSGGEYEKFFSELQHLRKSIQFDLAHFDFHVAEPYPYKGEAALPKSGGGTHFTAVANHFNQNFKDYAFCIILTDGYADNPGRFRKPCLWLITQEGGMETCKDFHGRKIRMK